MSTSSWQESKKGVSLDLETRVFWFWLEWNNPPTDRIIHCTSTHHQQVTSLEMGSTIVVAPIIKKTKKNYSNGPHLPLLSDLSFRYMLLIYIKATIIKCEMKTILVFNDYSGKYNSIRCMYTSV